MVETEFLMIKPVAGWLLSQPPAQTEPGKPGAHEAGRSKRQYLRKPKTKNQTIGTQEKKKKKEEK